MPNLKDIKNRITSIKKTRQITSAMKLVAGAKLKRATERAVQARPYQRKLSDVLSRIAAESGEQLSAPLLQPREHVHAVYIAVLTADRGLCGPFNGNLLRKTLDWVNQRKKAGIDVHIRVYGRKGADFLRVRRLDNQPSLHWDKQEKMSLARDLSDDMRHFFDDGRADEVWLAYNQFVNTMTQRPTFERVVPLTVPEGGEEVSGEHRWEPSADELMARLLPLYLRTVLLQAFLETEAGFYAAQMTAMDNATRNASDLIDNLTLDYNRARQAAITKEIIEIVSGAEAL